MSIRILSAADVRAALPMPKAVDAMRHAYAQLSAGKVVAPPRQHISTDKGVTLIMPAYLPERGDFGIKVVSVYDDNPIRKSRLQTAPTITESRLQTAPTITESRLQTAPTITESRLQTAPTITATVLVLDPATGAPKAFMDGASLTALRTGAGGGVAADLLARQDSETVGLFGAGVQARAQLQAVMAVRDIARVNLMSRTAASAEQFAAEISAWADAPAVNLVRHSEQVVAEADIVICATTSATPLFDGNALKQGTHITAVGTFVPEKREVDTTTIRRSDRIVVDSREACLAEAGDLIIPNAAIDAEIGEIVNGDRPGRQSDADITFFKSVGVAVQDAVAGAAVLAVAEAEELGTVIEIR